jgi:hypothetical protein
MVLMMPATKMRAVRPGGRCSLSLSQPASVRGAARGRNAQLFDLLQCPCIRQDRPVHHRQSSVPLQRPPCVRPSSAVRKLRHLDDHKRVHTMGDRLQS